MYQSSTRRGAFPRPSLRERKKLQTRIRDHQSRGRAFQHPGLLQHLDRRHRRRRRRSRGTFFNYFGYKEAVIVEFGRDLMVNLTAQVEEQIKEDVSPERIIYRIWLAVRALLEEHGEAVVVLSHELLNPDVERAVRAAQAFTLAELVAKVATTGQRSGRFRSSLGRGAVRAVGGEPDRRQRGDAVPHERPGGGGRLHAPEPERHLPRRDARGCGPQRRLGQISGARSPFGQGVTDASAIA